MIRQLSFAVLCVAAMAASSASAQSLPTLLRRCEEDSLTPAQAVQRVNWFLENYFEDARVIAENDSGFALNDQQVRNYYNQTLLLDLNGNPRLRPKYPTFGNAAYLNPLNYFAPPPTAVHPSAGAPLPDDYQVLGWCTSSCYKPDGLVRFAFQAEGETVFSDVAMGEALAQRLRTVAALSDESTLEAPEITALPVRSYTLSASDTEHDIYIITTESGGRLEVTGNHPVVDATGTVREARDFDLGDALVRADGSLDPIESIEVEKYFGRVYNLAPRTESLAGNVLIANGYLSGSSWYQNDGVDRLNSKILRLGLPDEVLE